MTSCIVLVGVGEVFETQYRFPVLFHLHSRILCVM